MIYYQDREITIRNMVSADAQVLADEEIKQGWHSSAEKYEMRIRDQEAGKCVSLTAEYKGSAAGYINVYREVKEGPFRGTGFPEIVDFGVLEKYRRKGIGTKLMDTAEDIASGYSDTICIGVGLHDGYGSAQRMYVKRGYIPDGSGVWYRGKPCTPYDTVYTNDDDLVLYLSKKTARKTEPSREAGLTAEGTIRKAAREDVCAVAELAAELWPEHSVESFMEEMRSTLADDECAVFLYEKQDRAAGFAQCGLRHDYVEGAESSPTGYLEGIYVKEADRRQGAARRLLRACEDWARGKGCTEFASDCELTNSESQAFHRAVGFREANRLVAYIRPLPD